MREIYEVNSLASLASIAENLDSAHAEKIFYGISNLQEAEEYKSIVNSKTGQIEMVAKKNYAIIQNKEAVKVIIDSLRSRGLEIEGRFDNFGGRIRLSCFFTNEGAPIVADDATGVKIGFRLENSYNGSSSFRLSMYGFRMICQNGMDVGSIMNNVVEVKRHIGSIEYSDLKELSNKFFDSIVSNSKKLEKLIEVSMNDIASWENVAEVLKEVFGQKKHRNKIAEKLGITFIEVEEKGKEKKIVPILEKDGNESYTRWDLYNAITNYATHDENVSIHVSDWMQDGAKKIFANSFEKLLTIEN